ncbi:MAG: hypothetical protein J6Y94_06170 [Bacteriovoracaceae bacterium]|nr:hypothetical protein [Bacteriovoracaceae bacterium]
MVRPSFAPRLKQKLPHNQGLWHAHRTEKRATKTKRLNKGQWSFGGTAA